MDIEIKKDLALGKAVRESCQKGKSVEVKYNPKTGMYKVFCVNKKVKKEVSAS